MTTFNPVNMNWVEDEKGRELSMTEWLHTQCEVLLKL